PPLSPVGTVRATTISHWPSTTKPKTLVYVICQDWRGLRPLLSVLKETCRSQGLKFEMLTQQSKYSAAAYSLRDAEYCVIWHGASPYATWAKSVRQQCGLPYAVGECGWFTQSDYWHFDSKGIIGESSLCGRLPEPTPE